MVATQQEMYADRYFRAEIVPGALDWLGDEMCRRTGRPREAAGTKGDWRHYNGGHRSQRFILFSPYCTNRTYSLDPGISGSMLDWVAAFDFTPGSATEMVAQCRRILAAMKAGLLDEVEEFFGNVDGDQVVDGWNNVLDRAATSDSTHLWHWHARFKRRFANSRDVMDRLLGYALGTLSIIKGVIKMGMNVLARAGNQVYLCDGLKSRTVSEEALGDIRHLGKNGAISLFQGPTPGGEMVDGIWNGWNPEAFGPLEVSKTEIMEAVRAVIREHPGIEVSSEEVASLVDAKLAARLAA